MEALRQRHKKGGRSGITPPADELLRVLAALEQTQLSRFSIPFVCVGQGALDFAKGGPSLGQLCIELDKGFHPLRNFVFRVDRVRWALRLTERTVNALIRVNYQKVRSLVEAIDWTNIDAIGEFAFDAIFGNDKGHAVTL